MSFCASYQLCTHIVHNKISTYIENSTKNIRCCGHFAFSSVIMFFLVNILEANKDDLPYKMNVLMGTKIICTPGFAEDLLGNLWGICLLCKFT